MTYVKRHTSQPVKNIIPIARRFLPILGNILSTIGSPFFLILILTFKLLYTLTSIAPHLLTFRWRPRLGFSLLVKLSTFVFSGAVVVSGFVFWLYILKGLPEASALSERELPATTKIYDRNGVLLYKIYKDQNRTPIAITEVPLHVRLAFLAAEDAEFYNHAGFSVRGISRAIYKILTEQEVTGGSTITQQLVKNAFLTPERTVSRKLKEIVLSIRAEQLYSKDQIFEMYLNEVPFGGTVYGIREASWVYFGKEVSKLTLAEASLLAGLPKSPTAYSPFGGTPEEATQRQHEILNLMVSNGFITQGQANEAAAEPIHYSPNNVEIKAPHFVMYVRDQLVAKYGEEVVEKGGLTVVTTLDYSLQQMVEEVVAEEVDKLENLRVSNGAALVLNPQTGEILAMVGSKDFFDVQNDGNVNVLTRLRQPGSSAKLINYTYALSHGYSPATILDDSPVSFPQQGQAPYTPKNYDGRYRGKITLRSAFAESRNIPAVRVLASYGVDKMVEMGKKMGITTWDDPTDYGLSLTLGGGDVYLLDLSYVYATIANYGERPLKTSIAKITDVHGEVLYSRECLLPAHSKMRSEETGALRCQGEQVVDPRVAYQVISILSDNKARTPAFGADSLLVVKDHPEIAVKTGTSNNLKDNVTLGFSQNYLVATWVGNNDSTPMSRVASGVTGASPIWNRIMTNLLSGKPSVGWNTPERMTKENICSRGEEWFLEEQVPTTPCRQEDVADREERDKTTYLPRSHTPVAIALG